MIEIKLTKRYPNSRTEDITDAYMRGWNDALDAVQNGKFHIADTPQTDQPKMTEEEIDTMLAKVLVGQTDCDDRYAVRNDSGEVVAHVCPLGCEQTDCPWK